MSWRQNRKELETIHFRKWMGHEWERERELDDSSIFYYHEKGMIRSISPSLCVQAATKSI